MFQLRALTTDERYGFWASAVVVGTGVGTALYFAWTGVAHGTGAPPSGVFGWLFLVATRLTLMLATRQQWARVGWASGLVVAVAATFPPLSEPGAVAWVTMLALVVGGGLLAMLSAGQIVMARQARAIAAVALVGAAAARIYSLAHFDRALGRGSVLSGW